MSTARCTASNAAARSATSTRSGSTASPYFSTRSSKADAERLVTATRSPRSSAASAYSRPNPFEAPVMNHVFAMSVLLECMLLFADQHDK